MWSHTVQCITALQGKKTTCQSNLINQHLFTAFRSVTQPCLTLCNPMDATRQASLSITNSQSLLKLMSTKLVMLYNHLIICLSLLSPSLFPSIRVFSKESVLPIRWPKYWSFSFNISTFNEYSGLISCRIY